MQSTIVQATAKLQTDSLLLGYAGARESIRFLPALNVKADEVDQALSIVHQACSDVFDK